MTQSFKLSRLRLVAAGAVASAALVACGGGGGDGVLPPPAPAAPATVPASAGVSITSFIAYVRGLVSDETSEPVLLGTFVAPADDTSEPVAVP